jgi:hypothetical protein
MIGQSINRCLREIWDAIFALACTDGHKTGCALSLVSKHIREISQIIRIQSTSLDSLWQFNSFQCELERRKPHERCVRFLYIPEFVSGSRADWEDDIAGGEGSGLGMIVASSAASSHMPSSSRSLWLLDPAINGHWMSLAMNEHCDLLSCSRIPLY